MIRLSTSELLTLLQAIQILLTESEQRLRETSAFDAAKVKLWTKRQEQFTNARDEIMDELGIRVLDAAHINWEIQASV